MSQQQAAIAPGSTSPPHPLQYGTDRLLQSQKAKSSRMHSAIRRKPARIRRHFSHLHAGDAAVSGFKTTAEEIRASATRLAGTPIHTQDALRQAAESIRSQANALDESFGQAHQALNAAFKSAYASVQQAARKASVGQDPAPLRA